MVARGRPDSRLNRCNETRSPSALQRRSARFAASAHCMTRRSLDLAALYAWQLASSKRCPRRATSLAEATIPPDMAEFLARWPVAFDVAKEAWSLRRIGQPARCDVALWRTDCATGRANIGLRIPLRPRRLKDYLVYEEHKKKSMARKGLAMPDLWYRMPTYTNRNILGLADPDEEIAWPAYSKKLDFEFELAVVIGREGRNIKADDAMIYCAGIRSTTISARETSRPTRGRIGAGAGKSKDFDQGNVLGPCIVTIDEIDRRRH